MKAIVAIICSVFPIIALPQPGSPDSARASSRFVTKTPTKPEIFTNGFIDIMNNGQVNASARFIRLFIGEPGRLALPISIYSGVSANNFQNQSAPGGMRTNDQLINAYINPLSGLLNVSTDGIAFLPGKKKMTKAGILYHAGERVLTGYRTGATTDPRTGSPVNFLNGFATAGIYFQTAAWERSNSGNMGVFWLAARYHSCFSNPAQIRGFLPGVITNGVYTGYSLGFGVEINNLVNLKGVYYKYLKQPEIDYSLPIYQFSFNYSLKN